MVLNQGENGHAAETPETGVLNPSRGGKEAEATGDQGEGRVDTHDDSRVQLKPQIGLFSSSTVIIGCIVGSGIFLSPTSVLKNSGSVGMSLVVWIVSGLFSLIGALCFAELGTTIPKSGGEYAYIMASFGGLPAFLLLWVTLIIINPTGQAIVALTFADYVIQPFFTEVDCPAPDSFVRIAAILCLALLTFVNSWSVPWATRVQDVFTVAKIIALLVIIGTGLVRIAMGHTENFQEPFKGSANGQSIALAFYGGLFAYAAWNYLNYLTEEIKEPTKNLPRGIMISLPMVTIIYVLANVAYFAVLSPDELAASNAVAVSFGRKVFGPMAWIMPVSVAMSTFGGVNGGFLSLSRLFFVGAREGQLPEWLAMIQVSRKTPMPSLVFTCLLSVMYVFVPTIDSLLNYFSFMTWLSIGAAVCGQIYLRFTRPDMERPIKYHILLPITFVLACVFLVIMGTVAAPQDTLIGLAITLTGFPVYFLCIWWENKPAVVLKFNRAITRIVQKLLIVVGEEKEE
ncbi:Y+L amino acid transporter 2-like isoform X2 [Diadema antillarum]|uniref:Y+L amino acid transporter 2-like isoform X2 n=1 Tax=Diadema antillarum TaxID=105358 RepID=UPI003A8447B9